MHNVRLQIPNTERSPNLRSRQQCDSAQFTTDEVSFTEI